MVTAFFVRKKALFEDGQKKNTHIGKKSNTIATFNKENLF